MMDEYVPPWNKSVELADATPRIVSTPQQVFTGLRVGLANQTVECSQCGALRQSGQSIVCYAYRSADAPEWLLTRCYCTDCTPTEIETPTLGTSELLLEAELGVVSDVADQLHECCLQDVRVVDWQDCSVGAKP